LPIPGLDRQHALAAGVESVEQRVDALQLAVAADQRRSADVDLHGRTIVRIRVCP
jgi:hypothetical protein